MLRVEGLEVEDRGLAGSEQGLCARVYLAVGKEIDTERERERVVSST